VQCRLIFSGNPALVKVEHEIAFRRIVAAENGDAARHTRFVNLRNHTQESAAFQPLE
jgi:hypothetical protein